MNTGNLAIALACLLPASVVAAPFCVVTGSGTNCFYYDAQSCRQAAGTTGACVVNPNEMQSDSGPRHGSGIRFLDTNPAIESYRQGIREGDRQRAEDQAWELRQIEIEQRQQDLQRRTTDSRLLPLLGQGKALTEETRSAIMSAVFTALDMNAPGTPRDWRNLQTGAFGSVLPQEIVQNMFGEPCRAFSVSLTDNRAQTRTTAGTACRKNGQWVWQGN